MEFVYHTIDIVVICGTVIICSVIKHGTNYYLEMKKHNKTQIKEIPVASVDPYMVRAVRDPAGETRVRKGGY